MPTLENFESGGEEVIIPESQNQPRRSGRISQSFSRLHDFVTYSAQYPIQNFLTYEKISSNHLAFLNRISKIDEPTSFEIAQAGPKWQTAMQEEIQALEKNKT